LLGKIPGGVDGSTASAGQRIPFLIQGTAKEGLAAEMLKSRLGSLAAPGAAPPQQQNTNPLGGLSGIFKKKKP
jgi:hypothetical protein